ESDSVSDPLHRRPATSEPIATIRELAKDPNSGINAAQVLVGSPQEAAEAAKRLAALPEVAQTRTLDSFVPVEQDRKLPLIGRARQALASALDRAKRPAPSDAENVAALRSGATSLQQIAGDAKGAGADAVRRLARNRDHGAPSGPAQPPAVTTPV